MIKKPPRKQFAKIGIFYGLSMSCSNAAILFVDYPTQVLAKCCKLLAVLLVSVLIRKIKYPLYKYICSVCISGGLALFLLGRSSNVALEASSFGIVLVFISLFSDGIYAAFQDNVVAEHKPHSREMMLRVNFWGGIATMIAALFSGQLFGGVYFLLRHPTHIPKLLVFCCTSVVGQNFIYLIITNFNSVVLTIVTTTRKFFTILLSILLNGHTIKPIQWIGMTLVFGGVLYDSIFSKLNKGKNSKKEELKQKV
ncbi:hypothetical protein PCE1_004362 [Barthelona sp. PCE]